MAEAIAGAPPLETVQLLTDEARLIMPDRDVAPSSAYPDPVAEPACCEASGIWRCTLRTGGWGGHDILLGRRQLPDGPMSIVDLPFELETMRHIALNIMTFIRALYGDESLMGCCKALLAWFHARFDPAF